MTLYGAHYMRHCTLSANTAYIDMYIKKLQRIKRMVDINLTLIHVQKIKLQCVTMIHEEITFTQMMINI